MNFNNMNLDTETEELINLILKLKEKNKEKYIEVKGIVKGILLSKARI